MESDGRSKKEGKIRSIGVSNMTVKIWNNFIPQFDTMPSVNQIEFNPYFQQKEMRKIMADAGVVLEAWGPLGQGNKDMLADPVIVKLQKHMVKMSDRLFFALNIRREQLSSRNLQIL